MLSLDREYRYIKEAIDSSIRKCLLHQKWILGPEVEELEHAISQYLNVEHCVGVSSGTEALVLALRALAIQKKGKEYFDKEDEIITTTFTFTATGDAVLRSGATPVFMDIDPVTYNIDSVKMKQYLESPEKGNVVGIIPVHLYGQACDMDMIMNIAQEHNLFVVEDTAQAFGGKWKDKKLGSIGTIGAFSFFPSKNLGGYGDGGMVVTNNGELAQLVRELTKHGGKDKYNVSHIGYNARIDTIQAAILLAKLKYIDEFNKKRRAIANIYNEKLRQLQYITIPQCMDEAYHVYHQYTLKISNRDELKELLGSNGVSTALYYPVPLHRMEVFKGRSKNASQLDNSENAAKQVLSIPIGPLQSQEETDYVIGQLYDACLRNN